MSGDDDKTVVRFPRVFMPSSLDAPGPAVAVEDDPDTGEGAAPVGSWPQLPTVAEMGPPLALTMPGVPAVPGTDDDPGGSEGALVLPSPEDPDNPTARDTVQLAMALMTALGVAAAQGMWHRARHRSALADKARAVADKTTGKAAGAGPGGTRGAGGSAGSKRTSALGAEGRTRSGKGHRPGKAGSDPHSKSRKGPKSPGPGGPGSKAPKADRRGDTHAGKPERRKRGVKGGLGTAGPCVKTRKPDGKKPGIDKKPGVKADRDGKRRTGKDATTPKRPAAKKAGRPLKWKASKRGPGPGGDKALPPGRKRWTRTAGKPGGKGKPKRSRKQQARRKTASSSRPESGRTSWTRSTPPPPPPGFEGMRPPPGSDRTVRVTVERVDDGRPRRWRREPAVLAGAPATGRLALSAGTAADSPASDEPPAPPSAPDRPGQTNGTTMTMSPLVPAPRTGTQYRDAELTVYDVIDADADMSEEILDGVEDARAAADGCEVLMTRLEALHAKIVELRVPGVLEGMVLRLIEQTATVKARADAIAERLPLASEAIATAGSNAAARHQPTADVTRDQGHVRPAEREYHQD